MAKEASLLEADAAVEMGVRFLRSSKEFLETATRAFPARVDEEFFVTSAVPAVVCVAFAVELGLKAIFVAERKAKTNSHELHGLFTLLSEDVQQKIKAAVPPPSYPKYDPPRTFEDALRAENNTFVEWRYSCEGGKDLTADFAFLNKLAEVVQSVAVDRLASASKWFD
jgi:HEPN domain-containing protein